jgi:hypothetical protein
VQSVTARPGSYLWYGHIPPLQSSGPRPAMLLSCNQESRSGTQRPIVGYFCTSTAMSPPEPVFYLSCAWRGAGRVLVGTAHNPPGFAVATLRVLTVFLSSCLPRLLHKTPRRLAIESIRLGRDAIIPANDRRERCFAPAGLRIAYKTYLGPSHPITHLDVGRRPQPQTSSLAATFHSA